jgi:predicted nucleic acid-binding protein
MRDKCFLDTNILIYSLDRRDSVKSAKADALVLDGLTTGKGVISFQVVQEFLNVALSKLAVPMTLGDAERYLAKVLTPMFRVYPSHSLYSEALRTHAISKIPWYDSLIVCAAREAGCAILYSEDLQHGQRFGSLRVVNPFL